RHFQTGQIDADRTEARHVHQATGVGHYRCLFTRYVATGGGLNLNGCREGNHASAFRLDSSANLSNSPSKTGWPAKSQWPSRESDRMIFAQVVALKNATALICKSQ